MSDVYISGVGMTRFGKFDASLEQLMAEAAGSALRDARLEKVDSIYIGIMNVEEFVGDSNFAALLADTLGLSGVPSTRVETASSTGAGALETAFYAISSGHMKTALVLAGEKMTHLPTAKVTRILSEVIDRSERRYGATMPALAAMIAQRYAVENHIGIRKLQDVLAEVAIKNHSNGFYNPYAQYRIRITSDHYFKSPMISYPLRLYDCAPITDGAAAVVLTCYPSSVKLSGIGHATDTSALSSRGCLTSFNSTREAAMRAYSMAGIHPSDIHFAEVHDAFTLFEILGTEDLGFFLPGEGWKAVLEGVTRREGALPINPSGGLKSRGHPVGASGLAQIVEIVWQLRGEAGKDRQLDRAEIGLAQSVGGLGNNNIVTILEKTDRRRITGGSQRLPYQPRVIPPRKRAPVISGSTRGTIETFTLLYRPPEGFISPLALALVKLKTGNLLMACNPRYRSPRELRIGQMVSIREREGLYVFEKSSLWTRIKERLKKGLGSQRSGVTK